MDNSVIVDARPGPGMVGQSLRWMLRPDSLLYIKPTLDPRRIRWLFGLLRNCNESSYLHGLEATVRLNERTFAPFDELQADGVQFEMHKSGLLFCFLDPEKRECMVDSLARVKSLGYSPLPVSGSEMQDLEPQLAAQVEKGIVVEQERQVRPESLVSGCVQRLLEEGAEVVVGSTIDGFERSVVPSSRLGGGTARSKRMRSSSLQERTPAGSWLGVRLPITPARDTACTTRSAVDRTGARVTPSIECPEATTKRTLRS